MYFKGNVAYNGLLAWAKSDLYEPELCCLSYEELL